MNFKWLRRRIGKKFRRYVQQQYRHGWAPGEYEEEMLLCFISELEDRLRAGLATKDNRRMWLRQFMQGLSGPPQTFTPSKKCVERRERIYGTDFTIFIPEDLGTVLKELPSPVVNE